MIGSKVMDVKQYLLSESGNFYKANLHSHSTVSDGMLSPAQMKELYKAQGYSILAYTDHDIFLPHHELTDRDFLALSGFECEFYEALPNTKYMKACHICFIAKSPDMDMVPCWNPEYAFIGNAKEYCDQMKYDKSQPPFVREYTTECINKMIAEGKKAGFFVTYNHPAWSLENYEQYTNYHGMDALEILNYTCEILGFPAYAETIYDDMLRAGKRIFAVAADDNHNRFPPDSPYCDSFGGYVMIKAEELTYEAVIDALTKGNFYASNGPSIYDLYLEDGKLHVTCSDAVKITLCTQYRTDKSVIAPKGAAVNTAVFDYDEEKDGYLRITVKDAGGNCAFSNAYFLN